MLVQTLTYRLCSVAVLGAAALPCPGPANAEPRSSTDGQELAQIIREAGYDCRGVERVDNPPNPPPGWESFRPDIVLCTNGKKFLVARTGRGGNTPKPLVRPLF
jgi:hypothetical protein